MQVTREMAEALSKRNRVWGERNPEILSAIRAEISPTERSGRRLAADYRRRDHFTKPQAAAFRRDAGESRSMAWFSGFITRIPPAE